LTKPVPATASTLQLVGSSLSPISNGGANQALWLRTADAKDEADPAATTAITFNATIDLHDFYFADQGQPPADASRASRGVFLAVWTTAGGLQVTPLLLWPIGNDKLASGIVPVDRQCSDSYYFPGAGHSSTFIQVGGEDEQGCYGFLNTNDKGMCTGQAFMWSRSAIWAPDGLPIGTEALNILDAVYLLHYGFLEPRTVGGLPAPLMPVDGGINVVPACTAAELTAYVQDGGTKVCGGVPLLAYKNVTTAMTDTPCANYPAGPALPRTATYERTMKLEAPFFDAVLGRSPPPTYQLTLN
jgi:hypothetical protein